jgi:hypothetical protein
MKKLLVVSLLILSLLFSLPVSAVPLADIHLNGSTVKEEITIEGTALPDTWVSIKITDKDKNIVCFSGVKTGEDSKYSFDLDLIGSPLPLDATVTYSDNIETFQIKGNGEIPGDEDPKPDPDPEDYDLIIKGKGVSETTYFTIEQLKNAPGLRKVTKTYKWLNSFGSTGSDTFEGVLRQYYGRWSRLI